MNVVLCQGTGRHTKDTGWHTNDTGWHAKGIEENRREPNVVHIQLCPPTRILILFNYFLFKYTKALKLFLILVTKNLYNVYLHFTYVYVIKLCSFVRRTKSTKIVTSTKVL